MLSLTGITPADESQLVRRKPLAFTLTTDVPGAVGVMVSVYFTATDTEEMVWDGLQFVGHYATVSVKSGDDFIILRRDGWPIGSIALRVRELGSVTIMSVWTDGTGVPSDGVGNDDDYYLDTATGQIYKRAGGTYSVIHTPATISSAAPTIGIGAGNTEGVASTYALSDHDHTIRTGATDLTVGTVTDGEFLKRVGTEIISAEAGGAGSGTADTVAVWADASTLTDSTASTGAVLLGSAPGSGAGAGESLSAVAGEGGATGVGGTLALSAGDGGATSGDGGDASLKGGAGVGAFPSHGGDALVAGGVGSNSFGTGGKASLYGGDGGTSGAGGAVEVIGGAGDANVGGSATVQGGDGDGNSSGGRAEISGGDAGTGTSSKSGGVWVYGGVARTSSPNQTFGALSGSQSVLLEGSTPPTSGVTGNTGGNVRVRAGNGGPGSSTGGSGGEVKVESGAGIASGTAGNGGYMYLLTGSGGTKTAVGGAGGQGGNLVCTLGAGGAHNSTGTGGTGGSFTFTAGEGGNVPTSSVTGGDGGHVTITSGAGGQPTAGSLNFGGDGGAFNLVGGKGGNVNTNGTGGDGATVSLLGGAGGNSPSGAGGDGGDATVSGGDGGTGPGAAKSGGAINLLGGDAGTWGSGGPVVISAGASKSNFAGSDVTITAGAGIGTNKAGGNINLSPGNGVGTGAVGRVSVSGAGTPVIEASSTRILYLGAQPAATATQGASVVQHVTTTITTTGQTVENGSVQRIDTSGGAIAAVNLEDPSVSAGQSVSIIATAVGNNFTLKSPAGNINGVAGTTGVVVTPAANEQLIGRCDGTDWWVVRHTAV